MPGPALAPTGSALEVDKNRLPSDFWALKEDDGRYELDEFVDEDDEDAVGGCKCVPAPLDGLFTYEACVFC